MHIVVMILFFFAFTAAAALQGRYFLHIFQLKKSCEEAKFLRWILKRENKLLPKQLLALCTVPLIVFFGDSGVILSGIVYMILAYIYKPRLLRHRMKFTANTARVVLPVGLLGMAVIVASISSCAVPLAFSLIAALYFVFLPFLLIPTNYWLNVRRNRQEICKK